MSNKIIGFIFFCFTKRPVVFANKMAIAVISVMALILSSCQYKKDLPAADDCSGIEVSFSGQIAPLMQMNCAVSQCHDAASDNIGGPFTTYSLIKNKALTIKQQVISGLMPQGSSLTPAQIKMIRCWVDSGAPNN